MLNILLLVLDQDVPFATVEKEFWRLVRSIDDDVSKTSVTTNVYNITKYNSMQPMWINSFILYTALPRAGAFEQF